MVNDKVKRAEKGSAREAEQIFTTREPMPSTPIAELESSVARNVLTF